MLHILLLQQPISTILKNRSSAILLCYEDMPLFLVDHYFVSGEDERLMCDSAKQYLSGVYNVIKTRYPSNSNYTAAGSEWYKKLRKDLNSQITLRCIELGKGSTSKSLNVERNISHNHASNQERRWHQSPFQSDGKC